jgi:transposase, IS5 family
MLRIHCPDVLAGAGYQGVDKRNPDLKVNWHVDTRPGKCKALDLSSELARDIDRVEQIKASIRAKVEHPFAQSSNSCSR